MTYDFLTFVYDEQHRLWGTTEDHRVKSVRKAEKFANFQDYGGRPLDDFKPRNIHDFFDYLESEGFKNSTINRYAAMLIRVFDHAKDEEHISHVPKFTWKEEDANARPLYYTERQLEKMEEYHRNTADWAIEHLIVIGHQTGMRLGEILSVNLHSIEKDDKGNDWIYLPKTKNGKDRAVPVNEITYKALAALDFLPARHFEHTRFYRAWGRMRRDLLHNDPRYCFHTLRHTAATKMANDLKVNSTVIGMMLGHKSEKTTAKYIKAKPSALIEIAAQMSGGTQ